MGSFPGVTLEAFLCWRWKALPCGRVDVTNPNSISVSNTNTDGQMVITFNQFAPLVGLYEPYRSEIENNLEDFIDTDEVAWRRYAEYVDSAVPELTRIQAAEYLSLIKRDIQRLPDRADHIVSIAPSWGDKSDATIRMLTERLSQIPGVMVLQSHENSKKRDNRLMELSGYIAEQFSQPLYPLDKASGIPRDQRVPHLKRGDKRTYPARKF